MDWLKQKNIAYKTRFYCNPRESSYAIQVTQEKLILYILLIQEKHIKYILLR